MHKMLRIKQDLIESSVEDAKLTLECVLNRDPQKAKDAAEQVLGQLPMPKRTDMMPGQMTRIAMLRTIVKQANKLLATSK
ncbi:hypothetical protein [Vibrio sp. OPT18]|uniref:hypothetical protein n=1 Tax=Vibrio sp. OPT18 TaxID=2778641 RepID=UPI00188165A6|nr:hypothetical protein [Vibrio sp. OPT18]MBE8578617.1 hypothetical protein [Vibrio sp. OPT18]